MNIRLIYSLAICNSKAHQFAKARHSWNEHLTYLHLTSKTSYHVHQYLLDKVVAGRKSCRQDDDFIQSFSVHGFSLVVAVTQENKDHLKLKPTSSR